LDDNVDHALLLSAAAPLAEYYMEVEPECELQSGFLSALQNYIAALDKQPTRTKPWASISLSKATFAHKVLRSRLLPRFAEMLLLVPDVSVDMLFWDFLDVVGNETDPKSISLGSLAQKSLRPDVILQYHKNPALIEHVGDVSSLEGKVQRLHEDFFRKHRLGDSLFEHPPPAGHIWTNLGGREDMLQAVYDGSAPANQVTCGAHNAKKCSDCPQGHGASWCNVDCVWEPSHVDKCIPMYGTNAVSSSLPAGGGFLEIRFQEPADIEIVRLRMGGVLRQWRKGMDGDLQKRSALLDSDFDNALDDAELRFGRDISLGATPRQLGCRSYYTVDKAVGREVFWRSTRSRPALNISCIAMWIERPQVRPLILRGISIRRARGCSGHGADRVCSGLVPAPSAPGIEAVPQAQEITAPQLIALPKNGPGQPSPETLERWAEEHFAWALTISVAFVSGGLAGILGCTVGMVMHSHQPAAKSRKR